MTSPDLEAVLRANPVCAAILDGAGALGLPGWYLGAGAVAQTVELSFGTTPAMEYARQMAVDSVIHSWDLARAIGADETLDPELVDYTYQEMLRVAELWRSGGAFAAAREPADDSTQAKMLALTGR